MNNFLYFSPDCERPTPAELVRLGIAYAFEGKPMAHQVVGKGPSGGCGLILCDTRTSTELVGYYPEAQTWRKRPDGTSSVWVGLVKDARPGPVELSRSSMLAGHVVRLADDSDWVAPAAMQRTETSEGVPYANALPTTADLGDDGQWRPGATVPKYAALWATAERFWNDILSATRTEMGEGEPGDDSPGTLQPEIRMTFSGMIDAACDALAANYRVSRIELAMLGAMDEPAAQRVLMALVEWPTVDRWLKKKARAMHDF